MPKKVRQMIKPSNYYLIDVTEMDVLGGPCERDTLVQLAADDVKHGRDVSDLKIMTVAYNLEPVEVALRAVSA